MGPVAHAPQMTPPRGSGTGPRSAPDGKRDEEVTVGTGCRSVPTWLLAMSERIAALITGAIDDSVLVRFAPGRWSANSAELERLALQY